MQIIHGDHQIASRNAYLLQRDKVKISGLNIIDLPGDELKLSQLLTVTQAVDLFGTANAVFVEGFFSRRPSNEKKKIIDYLTTHQPGVIFWEAKDVTPQLKDLPQSLILNFPLPKYIFDFLDIPTLDTFHKAISVAPVEQVFASLITRLHKALLGQSRFKTNINLKLANQDLLRIDFSQKTSSSSYDLTSAIEFWLLSL